jgi:hypothetical protein
MPFRRMIDFATAADGEKDWFSFVHKTSAPVLGAAARWADGSVGAGIPRYNAYLGTSGEFTPMTGAGNNGIFTGPEPAPGEQKVIVDWALQCSTTTFAPAYVILCDYLGHYALLDGDTTDVQEQTSTGLTRYTSGEGVRIIAVCTVPQTTPTAVECTLTYTNSAGVSNRTASFFVNDANIGVINCAQTSTASATPRTPFVPLANGDTGVRSVEQVQFAASAGGFISLVLVKPICQSVLRETATQVEKTTHLHDARMPVVQSGAYLNFLYTSGQSATSSVIRGHVHFAWG